MINYNAMVKFKIVILVFFSLVSCVLSAQEEIMTDSIKKESYALINITTPIDFIAPRYRIGYIHQLAPKWRLGLAVGFNDNSINISNNYNIEENYRFWEVRPQLYYMFDPINKHRPYFSTEIYYINHTDTFENSSYFQDNDQGSIRFNRADYKREKYGVNFSYGFMFKIIGDFGLNTYVGLGVRVRDVSFSNVDRIPPYTTITNEDFYDDDEIDFFGTNSYKNEEGSVFGVNFTFGVNLFYRF